MNCGPHFHSKVLGTGMSVPEKIVTNKDLEKIIETSDEWIFERTGIRERRVSSLKEGEFPSDLACKASQMALKKAALSPNDIDFIFLATTTPDFQLPNTASVLQTKLGITNNCGCLDIAAACSGFVYGVNLADSMVKTGMAKNVLVVGTELMSTQVDWSDRRICILFGDGCGAAIIGQAQESDDSRILSGVLGSDGTGEKFFYQKIGGAVQPFDSENVSSSERYMQMQGREMFKVAVRTLAENSLCAIEKAGLTLSDIDWVVPHQANIRILEATAKRLGVPMDKFIINIDRYANTSAATVPLAFHEAIEEGRIKRGDMILFTAFGAGLTSGATVLRY